jgi:tRNA-specific 2-thiouridylase
MCNKEVKFGAFLKKALAMGADYVATGHYAKNFQRSDLKSLKRSDLKNLENFYLQKSIDPSKDQSYFLWTLKQEQLKKILFPIGHLKKTEVRKLAKKFNLPVAEKKDSQGICFLGAVDLKDFLKHYIKEKKGDVVNKEGEKIGYHDGVFFHTLGERHGFTITKKGTNDKRYYIIKKDVKKNILIVSNGEDFLPDKGGLREVVLDNLNWISENPKPNKNYTAQIRYHSEFLPCQIICGRPSSARRAKIIFDKPVLVASGQSCVIYDKDICLGGGVVV